MNANPADTIRERRIGRAQKNLSPTCNYCQSAMYTYTSCISIAPKNKKSGPVRTGSREPMEKNQGLGSFASFCGQGSLLPLPFNLSSTFTTCWVQKAKGKDRTPPESDTPKEGPRPHEMMKMLLLPRQATSVCTSWPPMHAPAAPPKRAAPVAHRAPSKAAMDYARTMTTPGFSAARTRTAIALPSASYPPLSS
jgi:hypothetical protein